ncbi:Translation elongation factor EFG/EF2 [Aphelenchoides avenae]|nr:Translation elongation factor EFG/EF2 [Aphelenchus avenae]
MKLSVAFECSTEQSPLSTRPQAQTLTVWRQAIKFGLPSVFFVNKMDKVSADFRRSIDSIENLLQIPVVPVTIPVIEGGHFAGVVDLLSKSHLSAKDKDATWEPIEVSAKGREDLMSKIAEFDDDFANTLLQANDSSSVSESQLNQALQALTRSRSLSPVACGTALRNTYSAIPVLNMVTNFLPSPVDRNYKMPDVDLCSLVFKIGHDKRKGRLSYVRVYKGDLRHGASVHNVTRQAHESGLRLFVPFSDSLEPTDVITAGNIGVVAGLQSTVTGDTLVDAKAASKSEEVLHHLSLVGIETPEPVFFCSVEPPSTASMHAFEKALQELSIEDPSLTVREDRETGQTILGAMGELHIEVIKERLLREYGLNAFFGTLQVAYREVINEPSQHSTSVEDTFGEKKQRHSCAITLEVMPTTEHTKFQRVTVDMSKSEETLPFIRADWLKAINEGCKNALYNGPTMGYPVHNVKVLLKGLTASGGRLNPALLSAGASTCLSEALRKSGAHVIEPVMLAEVTLHDDVAEVATGGVLGEFAKRRGTIIGLSKYDSEGKVLIVRAKLPLSETTGIATAIRSASHGRGSLHMEFLEYQRLSPEEQSALLQKKAF